jgi:hypothetical protein
MALTPTIKPTPVVASQYGEWRRRLLAMQALLPPRSRPARESTAFRWTA